MKGPVTILVLLFAFGLPRIAIPTRAISPNFAMAQQKRDLSKFLKIMIEGRNGEPDQEIYVLFRRKPGSENLELIELSRNIKLKGDFAPNSNASGGRGYTAIFPIDAQNQNGFLNKYPTSSELYLFTRDGNRFSGELRTNSISDTTMKIEEVVSVFGCGNHKDPMHTSDTKEGIQELTKKYGCKGWHPLEK
jgi:hypothetical protein